MMAGPMLASRATLVALLLCVAARVDAVRSLQATCKKIGERCSLYGDPATECCGSMCTMPLECTNKGDRSECFPECRVRKEGSLKAVTFPSASGSTPGFEGGKRKKPAVVVLQEWWGVNDAIKDTAVHIAEQGYRVLIPDLYRGRVALNRTEAAGLSSDLNWTRGVDDVVSAVNYLRKTGSKRVAVVGFCQGGAMAFCAAQFANVDAVAPFYGIPGNFTPCNPLLIKPGVPLQAHFGTNDTSFPPARINPLAADMKAKGISLRLYTYEGLPHAFFNAITPEGRELFLASSGYLPTESLVVLSFSRLTNFLRLHLRR